MFFALGPSKAVLADANTELIATYRAIRDDVDAVISELNSYPHDKSFYDSIKQARPRAGYRRAARLIYLNKTAFNGIYRVNRSGEFNVPFGDYSNPTICQVDRLREAAAALKNTRVRCGPYSDTVSSAKEGDLVYFDPPYITGHTNNGFHKYNAHLFRWEDQEQLAQLACELRESKVRVVITNAAHPDLIALYKGFYCYHMNRHSLISGTVDSRRDVREVLLTSFRLFDRPGRKI